MEESEYWSKLGHRLSRELAGMPRKHRGALSCDGIAPECYWLSDEPSRIEGEVWIGYDASWSPWKFTLFLPKTYRSPEEVDWESLLPERNMTCWLAIDEARRRLQVEPSAAIPDLK